ncbi:MAG: phosphate ABC transporter substrate-binding protein PstS [Steroidobacteraceae bacterium]
MSKLTLTVCGVALSAAAMATDISGAGATFPYPIYAKWAEAYKQKTDVSMNYQSIGSGGGIKQIKAATVTFGASDAPLEPADLKEAGLLQFPMIVGGVVPVVNINGIKPGELVLDGSVLASIYLGDIKKWNDPKIKALNPKLNLPNQAIAPTYRSDGSGTNFLFTTYLSEVSFSFKSRVGANKSVEWPVGIGAKGNEGVASMTTQTSGAIGYVEYAYAKQNNMAYVMMKNKDGKVVAPESAAFAAAAGNADWSKAPGYYLVLTNQPGAKSWPITGASFILMHNQVKNGAAAMEALKFFDWAYKNGADMADQLDYVAIPKNVYEMVEKTWAASITADGKPLWTGK